MISDLKKFLETLTSVVDAYVYDDTIFITHEKFSNVDEEDVESLLSSLKSAGFDVDCLVYGFYSHPIFDETKGIFISY